MNTKELIMEHHRAIVVLEKSSAQMMLLWKLVGAAALVALGAYLTNAIGV